MPVFVVMKPVGSSANRSNLGLAGLGTCLNTKKKHIKSVYTCSFLYKKPKKSAAASNVIKLLAGPVPVEMLLVNENGCKKSWRSKVDSKNNSVSEISDVKNMRNMVAKETSYVDSNASETDNMMDDTTPKKTRTKTYVLEQPPKVLFFVNVSDNNNELVLLAPKFVGSNWLSSAESRPVKSFTLDVELSAVSEKTNRIIKSLFTSEKSLKKAKKLAVNKKILVNNNVRQVNKCLDQEIVIKKILVNFFKLAVESVFFKFGKIVSIKIQLIGLWQKALVEFESSEIVDLDSVHVAKAVDDKQTWVLRDQHRVLLYTLLVGTIVHNFSGLLASYGRKTCFIGHNSAMYVRDKCTIICFSNKTFKLAVIGSLPVFKGVNLCWASLSLTCCAKCKQSGHISDFCLLNGFSGVCEKQVALIACPVFFGGFFWAKIVGGSSFSPLSNQNISANIGSSLEMKLSLLVVNEINDKFVTLECSLVSLTEQVGKLAKRLDALPNSGCQLLVTSSSQNQGVDIVISESLGAATGGKTEVKAVVFDSFVIKKLEDTLTNLLITVMDFLAKIDNAGLVSIATCNVQGFNVPAKQEDIVHWHKKSGNMVFIIMNKFESMCIFTSGLNSGFLGAKVAIIMNNSLAQHVSKIKKVPGCIVSVHLLFKNKVLISIIGLYACVSLSSRFEQASGINFFIAQVVNFNSFVVLGSDFNEGCSKKNMSYGFCLGLGLSVEKVIDHILISGTLISAVTSHRVDSANHKTVSVLMNLDGLLDVQLGVLHKQVNRDYWKFKLKSVDLIFMLQNTVFSKFEGVRNKLSSKFYRLELLMFKIVSSLNSDLGIDSNEVSKVYIIIDKGDKVKNILHHVLGVKRIYRRSKCHEFRIARDNFIRKAVLKCMENFCSDKRQMIKSILNQPFRKMVLNYLIVNNELILEPQAVKSLIDTIIEDWIRKHLVSSHVDDNTFSGVMCNISIKELLQVIRDLPNGKTAGFSGIFNKLWKHSNSLILNSLLSIFNRCTLINTKPIALIKTAWKILSKIFSDRISLACSRFNVLHGDNFSVLKSTFTQSPIFVNMCKVYDSVNWSYLLNSLMCLRFYTKSNKPNLSNDKTLFFVAVFSINNISINTEKTVTIPINQGVRKTELFISELRILVAKKGESYCYLGIFLSTKGLSKPSLTKTHIKKQFLYLVSAVLQSIIYILLRKGLKFKANLPRDFPSMALYHSKLYGLKLFKQMFSKNLLANLINFGNTGRTLGRFFDHKAINLQTASWMPQHFLCFLVMLPINLLNCFLAGATCVLALCKTFLSGAFFNVFQTGTGVPILDKRLNSRGPIPTWFVSVTNFVKNGGLNINVTVISHSVPTKFSCDIGFTFECLLAFECESVEVYTDGSVKGLGSISACGGTATYFSNANASISVKIFGLLSSTLVELQPITLVLKCMSVSNIVELFTDSQTLLDICKFDVDMSVKGHSSIVENKQADFFANTAVFSESVLPLDMPYCFFRVEDRSVSRNTHYFIKNLFDAINFVSWDSRCGASIVEIGVAGEIDAPKSFIDAILYLGSASSGHLIVELIHSFVENHRSDIWLSAAKLRAFYEKHNLLPCDGSVVPLVAGLLKFWAVDVIHSLSISKQATPPETLAEKPQIISHKDLSAHNDPQCSISARSFELGTQICFLWPTTKLQTNSTKLDIASLVSTKDTLASVNQFSNTRLLHKDV
ncbi:hypothetical protein G9A89_019212 [Geosiphon pyriformis]|nr:hypothetical protein G9A89_019212 [Geosiphon pyriformis]